MEPAATGDAPAKDPWMPMLHRVGGELIAPVAPQTIEAALVEKQALVGVALRYAYANERFSTDTVARDLHVCLPLAAEVIRELTKDALADETMRTNEYRSHYRITDLGRERAAQAQAICS